MSLISLLPLVASALPQTNVAYPAVTDNRREVVNFNAETVRAFAQAANGTVYALNTHGSQILWHWDLGAAPEFIFQTIQNPVAIALWGSNRLVVAGSGTHALALHDSQTGDILNVLMLPSEPADVVVHQPSNVAFVACPGSNDLVRVDLTSFTITHTVPVPSERPRFLFLDDNQTTDPNDDVVFVAPFLSGNGSGVSPVTGRRDVIGDTSSLPPSAQLPDQDLFRIGVAGGSALNAIKRQVGTMLTAHGRHPSTHKYWMLNVESENSDPLRPNEPALRGNFAKNRLWIGDTPNLLGDALATEQTDLDDANLDGQYMDNGSESVAFPFGLAFERVSPFRGFICSPLNDKVSIRSSTGAFLGDIQLPEGSIPFDVEVDQVTNALLFVQCWGTNKLQVISLANTSIRFELDMGVDPTPAPVARGRKTWYDAAFSRASRSSCNTCHPGGKSDFLGWQISDDPTDRKDVMVTQSLLGIEDTFPYHWRGERALIDFNGAFVDLLGGPRKLTEGAGSEFEDFQAFVFSLQPHANPRELIEREIPPTQDFVGFDVPPWVDAIPTPIFGDAKQGLTLFNTRIGFNAQTCMECHTPHTGGNGDFINEVDGDIPSAQVLETPHLRELFHKDQTLVALNLGGVFVEAARSGFGTAHSGAALNIFRFIRGGAAFNLNQQESADVAAFVRRFDQGIAPAAHFSVMLNTASQPFIEGLLRDQALLNKQWIDVVAFGNFLEPGTNTPRTGRFLFTNTSWTPVFVPMQMQSNIATVGTMTLGALVSQVTAGTARIAVLGVPPGSGRRFALDPDDDDLIDAQEAVAGTQPFVADTDKDGDPDGHEFFNAGDPLNNQVQSNDQTPPTAQGTVDFVNSTLAKFHIDASEPVRIEGTINRPDGTTRLTSTPVFARRHTFVVQGLQASTPARLGLPGQSASNVIALKLVDRAGRTFSHQTTRIAGDMILPSSTNDLDSPVVLSNLSGSKTTSGSTMTVQLTATIKHRFDDNGTIHANPVGSKVAVFQVLKETLPTSNLYAIEASVPLSTTTTANDFILVNPSGSRLIDSAELPGPFLFAAASSPTGGLNLDFKVLNLSANQKVRVRLIAVLEPVPGSPGKFQEASLGRLQVPATKPDDRGLELNFP